MVCSNKNGGMGRYLLGKFDRRGKERMEDRCRGTWVVASGHRNFFSCSNQRGCMEMF